MKKDLVSSASWRSARSFFINWIWFVSLGNDRVRDLVSHIRHWHVGLLGVLEVGQILLHQLDLVLHLDRGLAADCGRHCVVEGLQGSLVGSARTDDRRRQE